MSAMIWKGEGLSSTKDVQPSVLLRESTIDSRLNALREIALALLNEVDSLKSTEPPRADHRLKLQDEVQRFETELIRCALAKTGGNQVRAARILGVKHTTLNAKIKRYQISFAGRNVGSERVVQDQEIAA